MVWPKVPLPSGGSTPQLRSSLCPSEFTPLTCGLDVFLQGPPVCPLQTDTQTREHVTLVAVGRICAMHAMWPKLVC